MNWANVLALTLGALVLFFGWLRVERRRRAVIFWVLLLPVCFLTYRWAAFKDQFAETWIAFGAAFAIALVWWLAWGRTHPPGSSDAIKVWEREDFPAPGTSPSSNGSSGEAAEGEA